MKKALAILLSCILAISFAACSKKESSESTDVQTESTQQISNSETTAQPSNDDNYTLGSLVTVNGETPFILNGLRLDGNRSASENNGKDYATEGIRSGFFLDERIAFYLDTDYSNEDSEDVKVICVPHRPFAEYEELNYEELTEQAAFIETFYGQEDTDISCFDPYVFSEDFGDGDYDVLFTYQGDIAYYTVINLTPEY